MSETATSVIAVVGPGEADTATCDRAEIVGQAVATAGADLVCGGLGGVMEAACRGARSAGGRTIGILPGGERAGANPHVDVVIPTGLGEARNVVVVRTADALIAVSGGWGTLSEIALAAKLARPIVGVGTWRVRLPDGSDDGLARTDDPAAAVALALRALERRP